MSGCSMFLPMDIFFICKWGKLLNFLMELGNNIDRFTEALQTIKLWIIYFSFFYINIVCFPEGKTHLFSLKCTIFHIIDEGEFLFALSLESTLNIPLYKIVIIQQSKLCKIIKNLKTLYNFMFIATLGLEERVILDEGRVGL